MKKLIHLSLSNDRLKTNTHAFVLKRENCCLYPLFSLFWPLSPGYWGGPLILSFLFWAAPTLWPWYLLHLVLQSPESRNKSRTLKDEVEIFMFYIHILQKLQPYAI